MKFQLYLAGRELKVELRNLAEQANADVLVSYGDTLVLTTCVMSETERGGLGFFPLTVDYEERYYAAGKIRGPRYIKRESRPSDEAICNARLIDRAIRPRFPKDLKHEVQVVITVLSWDGQNDPDIIGLIAASLALSISNIPWSGPIAAVRIGQLNGQFILNPTYEEREKKAMDLVLTGGETNSQFLINMIEGNFEEAEEGLILGAFDTALPDLKKIIDFQKEISEKCGKKKTILIPPSPEPEVQMEVKKFLEGKLEEAIFSNKKPERVTEKDNLKEDLINFIEEKYPGQDKLKYALNIFESEIERLLHENILYKERRPDGRKLNEMREITAEVAILPRTHGSGLFCRGQTKALSILTLGAPSDQQLLEGMEIVGRKRFMHHYNFPPYSVGEIRPMRGPGRRDIGHGMLAEKSLLSLIPPFEEFPYTIRVVSEILSSNGSTSMASVSSSSLALMDAGVPIKRPAAGIALGLISESCIKNVSIKDGKYKILTDIQGQRTIMAIWILRLLGPKREQ
jgi:polyribonucleotide nucleotidyltransferase